MNRAARTQGGTRPKASAARDASAAPAKPSPHAPRPAPARPSAAPRAQTASHAQTTPPAPPAYRPQPLQKCLQPKRNSAPLPAHAHAQAHADARAAARGPVPAPPTPPPRVHAPHVAPARPNASHAARPQPTRTQPAHARAVQPKVSKRGAPKSPSAGVVQATKLYPNLHPGAVERVEVDSVFKLSNFADQYRLRKTQSHGVYVPNQLYNFVRTSEGDMLLHNRYRHPSIAEGRQVLYAGEAYFNNGKLEWWSNGSGHYQPDSEDAQQAALPMDQFYSYQQVIKGEHKRKRG